MEANNSNLQVQTSYRHIIRIALPVSFAVLIPQLNFITNNIFLGHHSKESLAFAAITGVYYLIFASIGFGMNNGLQTLIARRGGENKPDEIGKLFNQGIFSALLLAAAGILITWTITPVLLQLIIKKSGTLQYYTGFLKIRIWGLLFLYLYQMRSALLVGTNQSRYLIYGALAEAITNIIFDYLLIFGKMGFPLMGFNGAAVASVIAEISGMFVLFLVIKKKGISKRFSLFKEVKWDNNKAKQIFNMSFPLMLQHGISIMSWWLFYLLIERNTTGETGLGVSNAMRNIFGIFGVVTWAFAATTTMMVSNVIGQGKSDQVVPLINRIIHLSSGFAIITCILLNIFPATFMAVFGQDPSFTTAAIPVIRVVSAGLLFMSAGVVWLNAVTGTGNSRRTFGIEVIAIILYCTYVFMVMEKFHLPITIGWMSEWLYWGSLFSLSYMYIKSGKWKDKKI